MPVLQNITEFDGVRVLTVREPWASLIVTGQKNCENRSRYFGHRGPLLIHASASLTREYYDTACMWVVHNVVRFHGTVVTFPTFAECKANCGRIIGGCEVGSCYRTSESFWFDNSGWAIELGNAWVAITPVPFKGQPSLGTYHAPKGDAHAVRP